MAGIVRRIREPEQAFWRRMYALLSEIMITLPGAEKWLREQGLWAQMKGAEGILLSILRKLSHSIDEKQYASLDRQMKGSSCWIGPTPVKNKPNRWIMTIDDLDVMGQYLFEHCCSFCTLEAEAAKKCKLRSILEDLPHHVKDSNTGGCPFAICEKENDE